MPPMYSASIGRIALRADSMSSVIITLTVGQTWKPSRQRQVDRLAVELHLLVLQGQSHDRHVLARALQLLAEPHAVEPLRDLRPRGAQAKDETAVGEVVDRGRGHRGHGGAPRWDLEDACTELDARGAGGQPGERCRGVGTVCLG